MKRRLLNFAAALSLLLFIASVAAEVCSYTRPIHVQHRRETGASSGGQTCLREVWLCNGGIKLRSWQLHDIQRPLHRRALLETRHAQAEGWSWDRGFRPDGAGYPTIYEGGGIFGFAFQHTSWTVASDDALSHLPNRNPSTPHDDVLECVMPLWFLLLLSGLLPAAWIRSWRRQRTQLQPTLCSKCGYDIRATPQRCPECGDHFGDGNVAVV